MGCGLSLSGSIRVRSCSGVRCAQLVATAAAATAVDRGRRRRRPCLRVHSISDGNKLYVWNSVSTYIIRVRSHAQHAVGNSLSRSSEHGKAMSRVSPPERVGENARRLLRTPSLRMCGCAVPLCRRPCPPCPFHGGQQNRSLGNMCAAQMRDACPKVCIQSLRLSAWCARVERSSAISTIYVYKYARMCVRTSTGFASGAAILYKHDA